MIDAHLEAWFTGMAPAGIDASEALLLLTAAAPAEDALALERSLFDIGLADTSPPDGRGLPEQSSPSLSGTRVDDARPAPPPRSLRVLRGVADGTEPAAADEFSGSVRPGSDLVFGDGLTVRVRHYGVADFEALDAPTALIVSDDDDFSAYLRDADDAFGHGRFANHATHPAAVVANLASLGGLADAAGPRNRMYLDDDGVIRTSPTGSGLGVAGDGVPTLDLRWRRCNAGSSRPDAAGTAEAIDDDDRVTALAERPWIGRYVAVLAALRQSRLGGRNARAVSGFGCRLTSGLPLAGAIDEIDAPVLAQFGSTFKALDPTSERAVALDADQVRALEMALVGESDLGDPELAAACQWLLVHGIARRWCTSTKDAAQQFAGVR